jgi:energy-converting hydrogenase Eha subunit F
MPKADYPQYEAIKEKLVAKGTPLAQAKTSAAKITNSQGGKVPPSHPHPRSRRKP